MQPSRAVEGASPTTPQQPTRWARCSRWRRWRCTTEQDRLRRCAQCGQLKGEALEQGWNGCAYIPVTCLCDGIVCRYCGEGVIRRPISNYFDEQTGTVWHVPWFGYLLACRRCHQRMRRADRG